MRLAVGALTLVGSAGIAVGAPGVAAAASGSGIVSDDFHEGLNTSLWSVIDPTGDGSVGIVGAGTSDVGLSLGLPGGVEHDAWNTDNALRVMQSVGDVDFATEVKFNSVPTQRFQTEGLLFQQDAHTWLRFDVHYTGSVLQAFSSKTVADVSTKLSATTVPVGSAAYLRVARTGSSWAFSYSNDGSSWSTVATVSDSLTLSQAGIFSSNAGSPVPAWTAVADYVFNTASPISPEDGTQTTTHVLTVNTSGSGTVTKTPDATSYPDGSSVALTADPASGWAFSGWSGAASGTSTSTTVVMNADETVTATFTQSAPPSGAGIISDDFHAGLNTSLWSVVNPKGDGSIGIVGAGTSDVELSLGLPGGVEHDAWNTDNALRVMQAVDDVDFTTEVKFTTVPTQKYQTEGLIFQQDAHTWLRFDVHYTGSALQAFASSTAADQSTKLVAKNVTPGGAAYLRVARTGSTWAFTYSTDGSSWTSVATVSNALTLSQVGPFAANSGSLIPAWTALADYVFNTASPVSPEDGAQTTTHVLTVNTSGSGTVTKTPNATSYPDGSSVTLTANPASGWTFGGWSGAASGTSTSVSVVMNADETVTATFTPVTSGSPPVISVWYGDNQTFGQNGQPQNPINILGNVSAPAGLASLSYSINGGAARPLNVGPDNRRLVDPGDFNADPTYADFNAGANTVVIKCTDDLGQVTTHTVTVNKVVTTGTLPYNTAWSTRSKIADGAQVVDGKWALNGSTIRTIQTGYDRTVALGDVNWSDYEVTVPFTMNGIDDTWHTKESVAPALGVGIHWLGHTPLTAGGQPNEYWFPTGAFAWYQIRSTTRFAFNGNETSPVMYKNATLSYGTQYVWKLRAQTINGQMQYFFKQWQASDPEPTSWTLQFTGTSGPTAGGIILVAHHVDVTFGDISIWSLSASSPPSNISPPTISGTPQQGQTLKASTGTWTNNPTSFGYQWNRCTTSCVAITNATTSTYVPTSADVGDTLTVSVSASNAAGPGGSSTSAPTATVTSSSATTQVIAANAASTNLPTESRWAGAQNPPYICCWGSQGQYVTFTFNSAAGPTDLALRYSAGSATATRKIEIDGVVVSANQSFAKTSSWNAWSTLSFTQSLTAGAHTLKVWFDSPAGSSNYLNLDNLTIG
jgi:uncharacterized repeat protein (TIGR02543 family)